ncbi:MAG: DUF6597 domain-containing transcriptional factor [Vicinamibacterales bacterium]
MRRQPAARAAYDAFRPDAALAPFIEGIWVQQAPPAPAAPPTTLLPIGRIDLAIHFGDPFDHETPSGFARVPRVYLSGQRTRPCRARATGATGLVLVAILPWAGEALFGFPMAAIEDGVLDLAEVTGRPAADRLASEVAAVTDAAGRARAAAAFVRARAASAVVDARVQHAVAAFNRSWGGTGVDEVARRVGLSRRQLLRRFDEAVGTAPKTFSRIVRGQKALGLLRAGAAPADAAARCGYTDQAHLTRELGALAGGSAGRLVGLREASPLKAAFNLPALSHFYNTVYL